MNSLTTATLTIHENEPCFELAEINRTVPKAGAGVHRFQRITVIRNDERVTWEKDMGKASGFKTEQFIFPGAVNRGDGHYDILHSVSQLRGYADEYRAKYDHKEAQRAEPRNLVKDFEIYATKRREARHGSPVKIAMGGK